MTKKRTDNKVLTAAEKPSTPNNFSQPAAMHESQNPSRNTRELGGVAKGVAKGNKMSAKDKIRSQYVKRNPL